MLDLPVRYNQTTLVVTSYKHDALIQRGVDLSVRCSPKIQ